MDESSGSTEAIPEEREAWALKRDLKEMDRDAPPRETLSDAEWLERVERRAALQEALLKALERERKRRKPRRPGSILAYIIVSAPDMDELRENPDKDDFRFCMMTRRMEAVLLPGNMFSMDYWPHPDTLYPAFAELSRLGVFYYDSFHEFSTRVGLKEGEIGNHSIPARAFEDPSSFPCAVRDLESKLDPQGVYRFTVPNRSHSVVFPVMAGMSEADHMAVCGECGSFMDWRPREEPVPEGELCRLCTKEKKRDTNERMAA